MESKDELPEVQETPEEQASAPESTWTYEADGPTDQQYPATFGSSLTPVHWTASEFVHHDKSASWFLGLGLVAVIVAALAFLITRSYGTVGVILISAVLFGIVANRKPQTLDYIIDNKGITIGPKLYSFASLKSFSVIIDGPIAFIQLMPVGRFVPPISVYFPPDQEEEIIETLGAYLPHEERKRDSVDRLMSKIHF